LQSVLSGLKSRSNFRHIIRKDVLEDVIMYANSLYDQGIIVELRWVPAHSSIEGNERVDKLAKRFRRSAQALLAKGPRDHVAPALKHFTVTPCSTRELHQALLRQISCQLSCEHHESNGKRKRARYVQADVPQMKRRKLAL
jgi:hypothetical protein